MNTRFKVTLSIFFILILIIGIYTYFQIDKFNKPYEMIEALIVDAETDKHVSPSIQAGKEKSEFNWDYFKRVINKQEFDYKTYDYKENYPLKDIMLNANRKKAEVNLYFYDVEGFEVGHQRILLEKLDDHWKAVRLID